MAGDGPGTDVTGKWRSMSHNKHWTKQKLAEARATWVRPNDEKTVVTLCTGSRCRKPLLPTAEQLERMQEHSLTIKQESDVRAAAAQLPGGFVDAGDILDLLRMGMSRPETRAERAAAEHARSAPALHRRGAPPLEIGPVGGPSGS